MKQERKAVMPLESESAAQIRAGRRAAKICDRRGRSGNARRTGLLQACGQPGRAGRGRRPCRYRVERDHPAHAEHAGRRCARAERAFPVHGYFAMELRHAQGFDFCHRLGDAHERQRHSLLPAGHAGRAASRPYPHAGRAGDEPGRRSDGLHQLARQAV